MKLMRRVVSLLSIALLIACVLGWLRSRTRDEGVALIVWKFAVGADLSDGLVTLALGTLDFESDRFVDIHGWSTSDASVRGDLREILYRNTTHSLLRFTFRVGVGDGFAIVTAPWWSLLPIAAILPAMRLRHLLRQRTRLSRGLCMNCGYDLRSSRDRCPECGQAVAPVTANP